MQQKRGWHSILTVLLIVAMVGSIVSSFFYSPDSKLRQLDQQMDAALGFTGIAIGTATALALVPDDSTTPAADQIAEAASYMAIACTAIMLEKFVVSVTGCVSLLILIPLGLAVIVAGRLLRRRGPRIVGRRILVSGLAIHGVIPLSLFLNSQVERILEVQRLEEECADLSQSIQIGWDVVASVVDSISRVINQLFTLLAVRLLTSIVVPILAMVVLMSVLKWAVGGIAGFVPDLPAPAPHTDPPRLTE